MLRVFYCIRFVTVSSTLCFDKHFVCSGQDRAYGSPLQQQAIMLASRSAFAGRTLSVTRSVVAVAPRRACLVVENAHKKGAGSTKNGRDSKSKRRGVKAYGNQPIKAGGIIVRQLGSTVSGGHARLASSHSLPARSLHAL